MGILDPPIVPPTSGESQEPAVDELVVQRWIDTPIDATLSQPLWIATVPWPCRFVSMTIVVPDDTVDPVIPASAGSYWDFFARKVRGNFVFPVPAQPVHGLEPGDILKKSTSRTPIAARFPFPLHESEMDTENRMFRVGDWLGLWIAKNGSPPGLPPFGVQARFEPT